LILERKASSFLVVRSDGSLNLNLGSSNGRARTVDKLITNAVAVNLSSPLAVAVNPSLVYSFIYNCFLFCFRQRLILLQLPLHRNLGMFASIFLWYILFSSWLYILDSIFG